VGPSVRRSALVPVDARGLPAPFQRRKFDRRRSAGTLHAALLDSIRKQLADSSFRGEDRRQI
jgi:hypothetical protein